MDIETDSTLDGLSAEPSEDMLTAGERLRKAREAKKLDLEYVAAETRIPVRHLATIEAGDYDALPSRAYAIGFSRTYAKLLGLDERDITDAVREELAEGYGRQSTFASGMEPGDPAKLPSAGLAWAGGLGALLLAVGVFAFYSTYFAAGTGPASLIAAKEEAQAAPAPAPSAAPDAADAEAGADGQVVFTAEQDLWVRFYDAGSAEPRAPLFEGTMAAGETFEVPGDAVEPQINTGRPDAFAITIDGKEIPKLADTPVTIGDAPISAKALLARAETGSVVANSPSSGSAQLN